MSGNYLPLSFDRWTGGVKCLRFVGVDLTLAGVDAKMQVRRRPNLPDGDGEPLIDFGLVAAGDVGSTPGLSVAGVHFGRGVPTSFVNLRTFDISGLPFPDERGDPMPLDYDIQIKAAGALFQRAAWGPFVVRAGVTQPGSLLTEDDDFLLAEDGGKIITE